MRMQTILPGFDNPVHDAGRIFRAVLDAMARPGRVVSLTGLSGTPAGMHVSTAAVALTLFDADTPVCPEGFGDDSAAWLQFHCGCPVLSAPEEALFGLFRSGMQLDGAERYSGGSESYPDRSATLLVQVDSLREGDQLRLEGPGIQDEQRLAVSGLDRAFWPLFARNRATYPLGVDVILCAPSEVACLPRTITARGPITCM